MEFTTLFGLRSQTTRLQANQCGLDVLARTGLAPSLEPHSREIWSLYTYPDRWLYATVDTRGVVPFSAGLVPVHSPLLRESLLVSFPLLTDMLKFSRYSHLSSGQERGEGGDRRGWVRGIVKLVVKLVVKSVTIPNHPPHPN